MYNLSLERKTEASKATAWSVIADFQGIGSWNPEVCESHLIEGSPPSGEGAVRHCTLADGKNWIRERVIEWREGESYTVEILQATTPLAEARATLGVRYTERCETLLYMHLAYKPRYGTLGALLNTLLLRRMMHRSMERALEALDAHVAGEHVAPARAAMAG